MSHDHLRKYFVQGQLVKRSTLTRITCTCDSMAFPHRWHSGDCRSRPFCPQCGELCKLVATLGKPRTHCCGAIAQFTGDHDA